MSFVLCFGEILWDLLPTGTQLGGAPLNFAYRIQELGNAAYPVSRLGNDEFGVRAAQTMQSLGLPLDFVQATDEKPTGTVPITLVENGQPEYVITPDVAYDHIGVSQALLDAAGAMDCIYFGTLVQRSQTSRTTLHALLDAAPTHTLKFCDINLRPECYTPAIVLDTLRRADIVKLSEAEIAPVSAIIEIEFRPGNLEEFAKKLVELFTLRACVVTRGSAGVLAAGDDGSVVELAGISINVADTIGAGDAFFAGFTDAFLRGRSLNEACLQGNVLGALAAQRDGGTAKITPNEIEALTNQSK